VVDHIKSKKGQVISIDLSIAIGLFLVMIIMFLAFIALKNPTTNIKKEAEYMSSNLLNLPTLKDMNIDIKDELMLNGLDCNELRQILDAKNKKLGIYIVDSEGYIVPINSPVGFKYCIGCPGINVSGVPCGTLICTPTGPEICGNGFDENCNGMDDDLCACIPIGPEICGNGFDENCNGMGDDLCACIPTGIEICGNGIDEDCDGLGDDLCACIPTGIEICGNGIDEDCDGLGDDLCVCTPIACSPTPTPGIDEDCDGNFDNSVQGACTDFGLQGTYYYYTDSACTSYFGSGTPNYCQSLASCVGSGTCFEGDNHWLAKWNIMDCSSNQCCLGYDYTYC
jgi:hypothetical protein